MSEGIQSQQHSLSTYQAAKLGIVSESRFPKLGIVSETSSLKPSFIILASYLLKEEEGREESLTLVLLVGNTY